MSFQPNPHSPSKPRRRRSLVYLSVLAALGLLTYGFWKYLYPGILPQEASPKTAQKPEEKPIFRYGFKLNGYEKLIHTIRPNQFFTSILEEYAVSPEVSQQLAELSRGIFDVRQLRAGSPCQVFCTPTDSGRIACKMVYETNKIDYVVFDFEDSVRVYKGSHEHERKNREVSGTITSSLYETFAQQEIDPALAVYMADIFAWSIDFYRIQKGDRFKMIYEADYVEGKEVDFGNVLAVLFNSGGKDFYAFRYEKPDKTVSYFDENGNSMRKMFLKAPVKFSRISSRFTMRRFHPVTKAYKAHLGTDYAAPTGTPILSTADGVVEEARYKANNGNYVKIRHSGHYQTQYLHMSRIAKGMRPGARVRQGDVIGYVGSTGLATGPHVCYRFWKQGKQVDPLKEKLSFSEPLDPKLKPDYLSAIKPVKAALDRIPFAEEQQPDQKQLSELR